jgi:hypothetical protein
MDEGSLQCRQRWRGEKMRISSAADSLFILRLPTTFTKMLDLFVETGE